MLSSTGDISVVVFDVPFEQEEHKHKSYSSCLGFTRFNQARYVEKKRSPLSDGSVSASGKGGFEIPAAAASLLTWFNSEWLK